MPRAIIILQFSKTNNSEEAGGRRVGVGWGEWGLGGGERSSIETDRAGEEEAKLLTCL